MVEARTPQAFCQTFSHKYYTWNSKKGCLYRTSEVLYRHLRFSDAEGSWENHEIGSMEKEIGRALFRKINVCRFIVQVHSGSYVLKLSVMDTLGIFDDGGAVG